jgi:hypothetical protein
MLRWYAGGLVWTDSDRLSRYLLRNSQNHAMNHEASCGRWVMDRRSFGPGYRQPFWLARSCAVKSLRSMCAVDDSLAKSSGRSNENLR